MPFEPVLQEKLSQGVVHQIEGLILRGILRPGERLPSERELSETMNVSRPSLREALADLQERGLLISRAGAGVFVADVLGPLLPPHWSRFLHPMTRPCSTTSASAATWRGWPPAALPSLGAILTSR